MANGDLPRRTHKRQEAITHLKLPPAVFPERPISEEDDLASLPPFVFPEKSAVEENGRVCLPAFNFPAQPILEERRSVQQIHNSESPIISAPAPGIRLVGLGTTDCPIREAIDIPIPQRRQFGPPVNFIRPEHVQEEVNNRAVLGAVQEESRRDPHLFPPRGMRYLGLSPDFKTMADDMPILERLEFGPPIDYAVSGLGQEGYTGYQSVQEEYAVSPHANENNTLTQPRRQQSNAVNQSAQQNQSTYQPIQQEAYPIAPSPGQRWIGHGPSLRVAVDIPIPQNVSFGPPVNHFSSFLQQEAPRPSLRRPATPPQPTRKAPAPPLPHATTRTPYNPTDRSHATWFTNPRPVPNPVRKPGDDEKIQASREMIQKMVIEMEKMRKERVAKLRKKLEPRDERALSAGFAIAAKRRSRRDQEGRMY